MYNILTPTWAQPLGRLCFCAYLLSTPVQFYRMSISRTPGVLTTIESVGIFTLFLTSNNSPRQLFANYHFSDLERRSECILHLLLVLCAFTRSRRTIVQIWKGHIEQLLHHQSRQVSKLLQNCIIAQSRAITIATRNITQLVLGCYGKKWCWNNVLLE